MPSTSSHRYVMHGGDEGRQRLRILAHVMARSTGQLFARIGVDQGWRCLDVGCGGGDVTLELARIVAPALVVGTDVDVHQLQIANAERVAAGIENIEYCVADAAAGELPSESFDLVYARFLLTHVADPEAVLGDMVARTRPGGIVAIEDIDVEGQFCHPPSPAFERYTAWYLAASRARGGDPLIGRRLPHLLSAAGLGSVEAGVVLPAGLTGDVKQIAALTLTAVAAAIVSAGVAGRGEVEQTIEELQSVGADVTTLMSIPRVVQAWGRRVDAPAPTIHRSEGA